VFLLDWIFTAMLVALISLPFVSAYPAFDRIPYELFYSALGSVSVVILAWDRIADGRMARLRELWNHTYSDTCEFKLRQTLDEIRVSVKKSEDLEDITIARLIAATAILTRSGKFHAVEYLYPKTVVAELNTLNRWCWEYVFDRHECDTVITEFVAKAPWDEPKLLWSMATSKLELHRLADTYAPYVAKSQTEDEESHRISQEKA